MSSSILIDSNVPMEMRDGMVLRADIYRPDDDEKHPVIWTSSQLPVLVMLWLPKLLEGEVARRASGTRKKRAQLKARTATTLWNG